MHISTKKPVFSFTFQFTVQKNIKIELLALPSSKHETAYV